MGDGNCDISAVGDVTLRSVKSSSRISTLASGWFSDMADLVDVPCKASTPPLSSRWQYFLHPAVDDEVPTSPRQGSVDSL
jgi:hypothetical protein